MKYPVTRMTRKKDLRKHYMLFMQTGLALSLGIFILIFNINFKTETPEITQSFNMEDVMIEEIIQTRQIETPPPPPRPPVPVEVPNDEVLEDEIINIDADLNFDNAIAIGPPPSNAVEEDEDEVFVIVEQMPELIGGIGSVQSKIVYPELAKRVGIEGRVVVQFTVDKEGNVVNPTVIRSIGGGCDEEAVRAVSMAKFKPGKQRGRPVSVQYSIPVSFTLTAK